MGESILKVGDKLDIRSLQQIEMQRKGGEPARVLKSIIYDILSDGLLEIGMPTDGGKMVLLSLGVRYELVFYSKGNLYRCVGQVKERYKSDNLYMLSMELKSNLSKVQRREYYRFECLMDIEYYLISGEEAKLKDGNQILARHILNFPDDLSRRGTAVDISGGGLRFISEELLEQKTMVLVKLPLDSAAGQRELWIPGMILQGRTLEGESTKYEHRVMFHMKDSRMREQIIKYIFEEERKSRKIEKG